MNSLMEQLHDIEGIDLISSWPLAIGWWFLIVFSVLFLCLGTAFIFYTLAFKRSWKNDTFQKLSKLEKELSESSARETVVILSEYLRRIVLKRFPRNECAGLVGEDWLKWLSKHDVNQFDWEKKGAILIKVPYAPLSSDLSINEIKDLIHAVRNWVY